MEYASYGKAGGRGLAGLLQIPFMFVVTLIVARPIALLGSPAPSPANVRGVAFVSLACVNAGQFASILWWRGLTPLNYFTDYGAIAEATYFLLVSFLAFAPLLGSQVGAPSSRRRPSFWAFVGRCLASAVMALFLTFLYHAAIYGLWALFRPSDQSFLVQVMIAPGIVLADIGFEAQMAIPMLNLLFFLLTFSYLSLLFFTRRTQTSPHK